MEAQKYTGVILAGGKNSRMGTDKGLLVVNGKKIIEIIADALKPIVEEIIIITNSNNYNSFGHKTYSDLIKDCGPMGGIYTALSYTKNEKNLIVSCDMPFISTHDFEYISRNSKGCEVAMPEFSGKLQPLCAMYSAVCLNKLSELISEKKWKLKDALIHFKTKKIPFSRNCFININTPEEYRAIKHLQYEHSY